MTSTDLIRLSEIATRAGVTPAAVSNWRRRHATFPTPVRDDLFDAAQIDRWLSTRKPRTSNPQSSQPHLAGELVSLARGEVDPATATSVAASLVTLCHLDPKVGATSITETATRVETAHQLPTGALSAPLRDATQLSRATLESMVRTVRDGLMTAASASELFDDIVAADRGPRAAGPNSSATVRDFLTSLVDPEATSVLDPACGTGSLLLTTAQHVGAATIQGYDVNPTAWALCAQRLVLSNLPAANVRNDDFFAQPAKDVDLVVCLPPLGSHFHREDPAVTLLETLGAGDSFRNAGDFAWLFATRNALSPSGTAIVVTGANPTFASGDAQRLRHELLRSGSVAALIALPGGLIPNTMIPAVVWILKPPTTNTNQVLLINADSAASRRPDPALLHNAAREYATWRDTPDTYQPVAGLTATVPVLELLAGNVALTPAKWTEVPTDPDVALDDARAALAQLTSTAAAASQLQMPAIDLTVGREVNLVSLHDLTIQSQLKVLRPRHINRDDVADTGTHPYVTGVTDEGPRIVGYLTDLPDHAVTTQPGDVILSTLGQIRAVVDRAGGHVLGSAVWLIRPTTDNPALQPDLLALLLASPRIAQLAVGTTVQRLRHPKDVTIPLLPADTAPAAAELARTLAHAQASADQLARASHAATLSIATAFESGVAARMSDHPTTVSNDRAAGQNGDTA